MAADLPNTHMHAAKTAIKLWMCRRKKQSCKCIPAGQMARRFKGAVCTTSRSAVGPHSPQHRSTNNAAFIEAIAVLVSPRDVRMD